MMPETMGNEEDRMNLAHESSSYWQRTVALPALSSNLPSQADVAIIGGGIVGAALGYWLARAGVDSVILERSGLAREATGRNGGFVSIGPAGSYPAAIERLGHETARAVLTLTRENLALLRRILEEEHIACEYREPGGLSLALNEQRMTELTREAAALRSDGVAAVLLDRGQVQERIGAPLGPEIVGGRFMPEEATVHPVQLVQGLVQAARRYGAQICATEVLQLVQHGGGVAVRTAHGSLQVAAVIAAVNAWTGELLPQLAELITPVRGQMLAYAPAAPVFTTGMSASVTATGEYWQQRSDGALVLGGCRAAAPGGDIGIRANRPTAEVQAALEQVFPRLFPQLSGLRVSQRWAGAMAFTPDSLPIVDRVPDMPGVLLVGGFCGHGMPFALRFGQLLAEAVTGKAWPAALAPFHLHRDTLLER